jgi:hypothetical protein
MYAKAFFKVEEKIFDFKTHKATRGFVFFKRMRFTHDHRIGSRQKTD